MTPGVFEELCAQPTRPRDRGRGTPESPYAERPHRPRDAKIPESARAGGGLRASRYGGRAGPVFAIMGARYDLPRGELRPEPMEPPAQSDMPICCLSLRRKCHRFMSKAKANNRITDVKFQCCVQCWIWLRAVEKTARKQVESDIARTASRWH